MRPFVRKSCTVPSLFRIGESVDIPQHMPFDAPGSLLQVKGRSRITLTRYVKIGKRTCAQLDVDIDISDLKVPSELVGEYKASAKGASVFYFDVAERCFVFGSTAMLMEFNFDVPMPEMYMSKEKTPDAPPRIQLSTTMDSVTRVSLRE